MKNQKYLYLVFIFLVLLISIQAVSASDDLRGDIISADDEGLILEDSINEDISTAANDNEELFLDESIEEDVSTGANDEELFLDESDEDDLGSADEETVLKESPGSFSDLNNFINVEHAENTTIHLSKNYAYTDSDEDKNYVHGVSISRGLTIEGHGVTIDGAHLARIFNVGTVYVTIRNINFINGNATGTGNEIHGGAIYCPNSGYCVAEYCNFTNNTAQTGGGHGGALLYVNANNCYFTENKADSLGGAIFEGDATNCNFTSNTAYKGGAIYGGDATNCNFTSNTADYGGAIDYGSATNCNFTSNNATYEGGAIYGGDATNCYFTSNTASDRGGAIYGYEYAPTYHKAVLCALDDQSLGDFAYVDIVPDFIVSDLTTKYGSGENLLFNLTYGEESYDGYNATITITQNGNPIGTFYGLTGEDGGWIVDLPVGVYNATLSLDKYAVEPVTVTITVKKPTFWDLNKTINGNDNATVYLSTNYTFDEAIDSSFYHGVEISRALTIEGNGVTIDGAHLARIFNVGMVNVLIRNINFINGNATGTDREIHGGAIYCPNSGYCVAEYCNFTNNTALVGGGLGGALFRINANNCYFTENKADNLGGAMMDGHATNCNFTSNNAYYGGAISYGDATNCNFTSNNAKYGGAIYYGDATNCSFTSNNATRGGAIDHGSATNCNFTSNTATYEGGAIYGDEDEPTYYKAVLCALDDQSLSDFVYVEFIVPDFIVSDLTTKYGSGEKLLFNLTYGEERYDGYNATINITQNGNPIGTFYGLTGEDGGWIVDLPVGVYNATLSLDKYAVEPVTVTITVTKAPTNVTVDCDDEITLNQGETGKINAALTPNVGQLSYSSSDDSVVSIDQEGNIITHNAGTALITISFAGNENYTASSKTVKVTVKQISTEITAPSITATYNVNKDLVITLKDSKGNALSGFKVSVDLNGAKEYTTDDKGTIIVPTKGLNAGTYTAKIAFAGNSNYAGSSATAKVTVNKDSPKITSASVSTTYNVNKNLVITLKDSQGKPLSGVKVTVNFGGDKKYTTDKNGQVKVAIGKLVPKAYTAKISFAGNANYNGASATAKVTVKKATAKMTAKVKTFKFEDKTKKYKVTLKDNKGKALKNAKITLKVKGKTYTAKTNSKGVATFKLKKLSKNGKYSAVIKYAGDKYYKKLTKKVKITVKKPAWKTVSKGSKDKATVKKIQRALKDNGYYLSYKGRYLKIDGLYHKYTVRAVKQFQKAKGLKVSGKVDYKTAKKLKIVS